MAAAGRKLGDAYIAVTADASKIGDDLSAKATAALDKAARSMGDTLDDGLGKAVEDSVDGLGDTLGDELDKGTERAGGKFRDSLRKNLSTAIKDLPDITLGTDATEIDRELAGVREKLATLSDAHIGVDVSTADALAELTALRATLDGIGKSTTDISVRADTAAASAELAKVELEVSRLDGQTAEINVRTDSSAVDGLTGAAGRASGGVGILLSGILALAPALIPIGAAAVAALGAIGPLAAGAGAGLAVMLVGFSGVGDAVKLLGQRHDAAAAAAGKSASSQVSSASAVESAQRSLANTVANNADAAAAAAAKVVSARRTEADAVVSALRSEQEADRALQQALADEATAQLGVTSARRQAQQQLEDLTNSLADNALAQRRNAVDVISAKNALDAVLRNPYASKAQLAAAQLAYDEQIQQQSELKLAAQRLADQQTDAAAKGVDGADVVVAAQQKLAAAQQKVADAQQKVTDAQVSGARAVADAQQGITDALHAQEVQARQAAYSIAQAQSALAQAGQSAAGAGSAGASALAAIDAKLAKLDPATRAFADYVDGTLQPIWERLKGAAAGGLLPGVQAGLEKLQPILPQITGFFTSMSSTLGGIFSDLGDQLSSPFWTDFFAQLQNVAGPALQDMYDAGMNVVRAIASIVKAFMPMSDDLGNGLVGLTQDFADWAKQLGDSKGFKDFIAYVKENGPKVLTLLGNLVDIVKNLISGMADQGGGTLDLLVKISGAIAGMDPSTLAGIADAIGGLAVAKSVVGGVGDLVQQGRDARDTYHSVKDALSTAGDVMKALPGKLGGLVSAMRDSEMATKAWAIAQRVLNAVMNASPLGIVLTVLGLLVGAFITAYASSETFRDIVGGVLSAVGDFFVGLWDGVKAVFGWISDHWPLLLEIIAGPIGWAIALFTNFGPQILSALGNFGGMIAGFFSNAFQWVVNAVVSGVQAVVGFFTGLPGAILRALGNLGNLLLGAGGDLIQGLVNGIARAASFVGDVAKNVVNAIIRFINDKMIDGINGLLDFHIAGIHINVPDIPHIPLLADGAIVNKATLAVVGEAGPEAVIPLSPERAGRRAALMDQAGLSGNAPAAPAGGGDHYEIDARQYFEVKDTQTAEEVGAVMGQRVVHDVRNGISNRYTAVAA